MADLSGSIAKLDRAEFHLKQLEAAIEVWRDSRPATATGHENADRTEITFTCRFSTVPDLTGWGLIIGDCVHNLRSALDHVVWQAAGIAGRAPSGTEFPIFTDKVRFLWPETKKGGGLYKIRGIKDRSVRAFIEDTQPWKRRPQGPNDEHLAVLHALDINDKHRVLSPIAVIPRTLDLVGSLEFADEGDAAPPLIEPLVGEWDPIEDGTPLFVMHLAGPVSKVKMEFGITLGIALPVGTGQVAGGVTGTLGELCKYTRWVVEELGNAIT